MGATTDVESAELGIHGLSPRLRGQGLRADLPPYFPFVLRRQGSVLQKNFLV